MQLCTELLTVQERFKVSLAKCTVGKFKDKPGFRFNGAVGTCQTDTVRMFRSPRKEDLETYVESPPTMSFVVGLLQNLYTKAVN